MKPEFDIMSLMAQDWAEAAARHTEEMFIECYVESVISSHKWELTAGPEKGEG